MRRIYGDGVVSTLPAAPSDSGATDGYFSAGDPLVGRDATPVPEWWLNLVQETLMDPITAAGLTGSISALNQLTTAISLLIFKSAQLAMPGWLELGSGLIINWLQGPWDPASNTEPYYNLSFAKPFKTACLGVWTTVQISAWTTLSDCMYQVIGTPTKTTVAIIRNITATDYAVGVQTRATVLAVGV